MEINREIVKQPLFWQIAVPVVLFIMALVMTVRMSSAEERLGRIVDRTQQAQQAAADIRRLLRDTGGTDVVDIGDRRFDPVASARRSAQAAGISEVRITRGESTNPRLQQDGSMLYRETYRLNVVRLLQVARFIDFAERNYDSVKCTDLSLNPVPGREPDVWDATIDLQYLRR